MQKRRAKPARKFVEKLPASDVILNNISDQVMIVSRDFKILYANQALLDAVGLKRDEVLGRACYEITHHRKAPCEPPKDPCPLSEAAGGEPCAFTHVHYDAAGKEFFVEVIAFPLKEKGEITKFLHVAREVTQLRKMTEKMRIIYEESREFTVLTEPKEICSQVLSLACKALEADGGSVMLFDEESDELVVEAASGTFKDVVLGKRFKLGERFAGRAALLKNSLLSHEVEDEEWFKSLKKYEEIKSGMSCPMLVGGKLIGVLNLKRTEREENFTRSDVELASVFACHAAAVIENAKLRRRLETRVKELEEFHEVVVGRELKMKELEEELERLKAKLGEK